jgi:hypothetical protein
MGALNNCLKTDKTNNSPASVLPGGLQSSLHGEGQVHLPQALLA